MQSFLMYCFYDGMTVEQAKKLYKSAHGKEIKDQSIKVAVQNIFNLTGKVWA